MAKDVSQPNISQFNVSQAYFQQNKYQNLKKIVTLLFQTLTNVNYYQQKM